MESARGLRFAANLSFLFPGLDFLQRFQAAKNAGFSAVESAFPVGVTLEELKSTQQAAGIQQVHLNLPAGDWAKGDRGLAADPGRVEEFKSSVHTGVEYALALQCKRLHAMAGVIPDDANRDEWKKAYVTNLRWAADLLSKNDILLLIEPISSIPGYFLQHQQEGLDVIKAIGHQNLKLQFDIFHAQRKDGNLCDFLSANIKDIGHIQIGQVPGRHEPNSPGELNFLHIFSHIKSLGYEGWIGCEYVPAGDTAAGLSWMPTS